MDIFSVTSKQVETATTPKAANTTPIRQVEETADTTKVEQQRQDDNNDTVSDETKKTLSDTVKELNKQMDLLDTNITFGYNEKINQMFINVMEKSTGKIIRKFPTEEAMNLSLKMKEIVGIIFDKKG